ncbi:hypothetical protein PTTG_02854 [Puccinia triticina 1-1 BBBD Race 1]|uniref:Chitinase n=1 Tax=Puccinia triticina (isolate 1-1 / race 1 (BBBD)) TaxID=630390 RepID=A0A180GKJ0_PUCT1|nr:hypothetical protein PTTG_02854 [Puccinia triticina 1-1 BBBD Race 1]
MLPYFSTILTTISLLSSAKSDAFGDKTLYPSPPPMNIQGNVIIGYYQASRGLYQQLESVPWKYYNNGYMVFQGVWPIEQFRFTFGSEDENTLAVQNMEPFVQAATRNQVTPLLGIGGEQGSKLFSYYMGSGGSRTTFVRAVVDLAKLYNFQGVVVTWLSPNDRGAGCNNRSPEDVVNFGYFAQEFKKIWKEGRLIVRVNFNGFIGALGTYATPQETSLLAQNADYVDLMAYDGYTGNKGDKTGPFSALTGGDCPKIPYLSNGIKELLQVMNYQGFSPQKLILGFTGYGRLFYLPQQFDMKTDISQVAYGAAPQGGWADNLNGTVDSCNRVRGYEGIYLLTEILNNGWLARDGVTSTQVLTRGWDECSKQPYLYDNKHLLVYDDPGSLSIKSNHAKQSGLAGVSL